jgi:hypothetical protein
MTRAIDGSALLLLLAMGCRRDDAIAKEAPRVSTSASTTSADASVPPSEAGAPGSDPYARLAPIAMGAEGYAGFSKDDRYLGYEISTCETCPDEPTLSEDVREKRQKAHDAEVDRKLTALGVQRIKDGRTRPAASRAWVWRSS